MDPHGALFFCLCLLAAQVVLVETQSEILTFMKRLEQPIGRSLFSRGRHIQHLEQMLLNASFCGHNLTLQTNSIQSLVFKLSCDFSGLSLSSATLTNVSQAWAPHAMQFPDELTKGTCVTSRPAELRLICIYFFTTHLFQDDQNSLLLNNYVLGAQLDHKPVKNLQKPVNISFWHNRSLEGYTVTCVFWKEGASNRSWGAWSPEGCYTEQPSGTQVLCHCNHLTYFAVLMQFSGDPVPTELRVPLEYISLVGCSISIVASLLSILLCAHSRKQSDSTTGIHMNLHGSVLLLNVTFLLSSQMALPTVPRPVCMVLAATLHYALLSSLTWMAIEGLNLYLLLGRVYNIYIHRYLLKLCLLGWGSPAFLVLLLLVVRSSVYGPCVISFSKSQENGTGFQNVSITQDITSIPASVQLMWDPGEANAVGDEFSLFKACREPVEVETNSAVAFYIQGHQAYHYSSWVQYSSVRVACVCVVVVGCWICSPMVRSILVMGYGGLTSLFNLVVLAWALWIVCRLRAREKVLSPWAYRDTVMVLGLTVLLGTTWTLAFFSFGVFLLPQLFLFTIFNSLYGFFLFLWFCSQKRYSDAEAKAGMEAVSSSQMMH